MLEVVKRFLDSKYTLTNNGTTKLLDQKIITPQMITDAKPIRELTKAESSALCDLLKGVNPHTYN